MVWFGGAGLALASSDVSRKGHAYVHAGGVDPQLTAGEGVTHSHVDAQPLAAHAAGE